MSRPDPTQTPLPAGKTRTALGGLRQFAARHLDEAFRMLEWRRGQRILTSFRLPLWFTAGGLLLAFCVSGRPGVLLVVSMLAATLFGFLRAQHLWNQEHARQSLDLLLLTRQQARCVVRTIIVTSAGMGLCLTAMPILLGLIGLLATFSPQRWWPIPLTVVLLILCALTGSAAGASTFFLRHNLAPKRLLSAGGGVLLLLAALAWWRVSGGASPGWTFWEQFGQRLFDTLAVLSPIPALFGLSEPRAWAKFSHTPVWLAGTVYSIAYAGLTAFLAELSTRGFQKLASDPSCLRDQPRRPREAESDGGREYYWQGFRNPVWTRDIRTRLRNRETIEFIFFASVSVAAGAFIPLILHTRELSDPLKMAETARHVFSWLTMTLLALVALITPGLTADAITQERSKGTLELLVASTLRPRDILMGKLLGAVCVMLLLISPSLPLFGLCRLFHGASTAQVLQVYLLLTVTLTLCSIIGIMQSTITKKPGMAKFLSYAITAVLVAFPGGPFWVAAAISAPDAQSRQSLISQGGVTAVVGILWLFVLLLLWGHAREELEY